MKGERKKDVKRNLKGNKVCMETSKPKEKENQKKQYIFSKTKLVI